MNIEAFNFWDCFLAFVLGLAVVGLIAGIFYFWG
jgi:hypothetical protein